MTQTIINQSSWIPSYSHQQKHLYILLTSLNLGGAEKIVSDQLWANHYSKYPQKITLIVIYDKEKEHSIPPEVNVVRLNGKLSNGEQLFKQISYEGLPLVCHLINDIMANYLFSQALHLHIVIHNDKRGWSNTPLIFNHPQVISLVAVCEYVEKQLKEVTNKPVFVFRHQINPHQYRFKPHLRQQIRRHLNISDDTIVIGMTGRICHQKNYFLALDVLAQLLKKNPNYKLIILGGIEKVFTNLYLQLLKKINTLKLHNNVLLPGFKTEAYAWLNCFDIGLNTSYYEGLSMATQEFMANGLPMIVSNVSGQHEIYNPNNQLQFFELPTDMQSEEVKQFNIYEQLEEINIYQQPLFTQYQNMVQSLANLIEQQPLERVTFNENTLNNLANICYGSHNNWNMLNHIKPVFNTEIVKPAFLTSNLNLGGAQRSLVNLLVEFQKNNNPIPLILLNQSNQTQFYLELLEHGVECFLSHQSIDVFDIFSNLFNYIFQNKINRIVLWNVDTKIKLLLSKFLGHIVDIIDVSPGDYCFVEMDNEQIFQEAIYYKKENFYSNLYQFVSKYDNSQFPHNYSSYLQRGTIVIPNGVPTNIENIYTPKNKTPFKFLVCGRIAPSKHLDIIIPAFINLLRDNPNIVLDIVGSTETYYQDYFNTLNENYKEYILSGKINWSGHHDYPQSIMKNYHAIIVLGTHQGSPNVVLEAASCKLPIIANDSGGTKDIINEHTGILLPSIPNMGLLNEAMNDMINNYETYLKKSDNCYELVCTQFSMTEMYQKYLKVICL